MNLTIRRAQPQDASALAAISAQNFTETFGASYPPADLASYLAQTYAPEKQQQLLSDPRYAAFLLEHNGVAVGHALAGPCGLPHPDVKPGDGELKRLYVLREFHNAGHGTRLFEAALQWLEQLGQHSLWIGVWSENYGAQRFYARYGFLKVGEYLFPVGASNDLEFILRRT